MTVEFLEALRPLFDCLTDGVCIADAEGRLLYANAAAGRLLGPAAEEAAKVSVCALLCGRFEGACGGDAAACPLRVPHGEQDAVLFKGHHLPSRRDLRVRCLRARLPSAERHFLLIEDDSAEADLERRHDEWRQMFAHDVRVPLTGALGALRTIEDLGAGHPLAESDLGLIRIGVRGCRSIEALINAYLETARLKERSMPVSAAPIDIGLLIRETVEEQAAAARARGLELTSSVPSALNARADPELLRRALLNLLGNALKFTPSGGRVSVEAAAKNGSVLIRIADNGPGIPARDLPRIFERFYQGADAGRRPGLGLGLGLTFCREALRAMGGEVTVESQEGKGSVFTLQLPAAVLSAAPPGK